MNPLSIKKLKFLTFVITITILLVSTLGSSSSASNSIPASSLLDVQQEEPLPEMEGIPYTNAVFLGSQQADFPSYFTGMDIFSRNAAMIAAYYDRNGFKEIYTGPSNNGLMPLNGDYWGSWYDVNDDLHVDNPLIASRLGLDGRVTKGTYDDYWIGWNNSDPDPYITGSWTEHTWGDTISDYMKSSQSAYNNKDGYVKINYNTSSNEKLNCLDMEAAGTSTNDAIYGLKQFYEARGYEVTDCFIQLTDNKVTGGFSYMDYKAQIDSGNPVFLNQKADGTAMTVGYGYSGINLLHRNGHNLEDIQTTTWDGIYDIESVIVVNIRQTSTIPNLTQPYAKTADDTPRFRWTAVKDAEEYELKIFQDGSATPIHTEIVQSDACGTTYCTVSTIKLSPGVYNWLVTASVGSVWMESSTAKKFTVISAKPTLVSPKGPADSISPTFTWKSLSEASQYQIRVFEGSTTTPLIAKKVPLSACTSATCSTTLNKNFLPVGDFRWQVQALINGSWRPWSAKTVFNTGFNSQFSSDATGWSRVTGVWTVNSGLYQTAGLTNKFTSAKQKNVYTTFTYTVKLKATGCVSCSHGVIFLGNPTTLTSTGYWKNGFVVFITNNQYRLIGYLKNGTFKAIRGWEADNRINKDWNVITIQHNKETGYTKINLNKDNIYNGYLQQFSSGQVGVGYYQDDIRSSLYIDYATLTTTAERNSVADLTITENPIIAKPDILVNPSFFNPDAE
jgi:hypothetical protein